MRKPAFLILLGSLVLAPDLLLAGPPEYSNDPFGDADFADVPLITDVAHPTRGRGELALMYSTSTIDKYTSHLGGMLEFNYHFLETVGVGVSFGWLHGSYTTIVTSPDGIIGNKVKNQCQTTPQTNCDPDGITPSLPDNLQLTGVIDAVATWSPLYGKINVVSELDVNLQLYGLIGGGVHGSREVKAEPTADIAGSGLCGRDDPCGYNLVGGEIGEGGLFSNPQPHLSAGVGLRIFLLDWLALRGEIRYLGFLDSFVFDKAKGEETYISDFVFAHIGLGAILFD